jgi:tetratricopeptide (TPR) repeat protein
MISISIYLLICNKDKLIESSCFKKNKLLIITLSTLSTLSFLTLLYYIRPLSVKARILTWKISFISLKENIWCGNGIGSFLPSLGKSQDFFFIDCTNSNEINLADTPAYAFCEYIEFASEIGLLRLGFLLIILYTITRKSVDSIFKYGIISILLLSTTSYPLHILPIQLLFLILITLRRETTSHLSIMIKKLFQMVIFLICAYSMFNLNLYIKKINTTQSWIKEAEISRVSIIETRNLDEYEYFSKYLSDNSRFLFDYGSFLYRKGEYYKSINIFNMGNRISNDPVYLLMIGKNHEELNNYSCAEFYYTKAFNRVPNRIYPLYSIALLHYKLNNIESFSVISDSIINFRPKIQSKETEYIKNKIMNIKACMEKK